MGVATTPVLTKVTLSELIFEDLQVMEDNFGRTWSNAVDSDVWIFFCRTAAEPNDCMLTCAI